MKDQIHKLVEKLIKQLKEEPGNWKEGFGVLHLPTGIRIRGYTEHWGRAFKMSLEDPAAPSVLLPLSALDSFSLWLAVRKFREQQAQAEKDRRMNQVAQSLIDRTQHL